MTAAFSFLFRRCAETDVPILRDFTATKITIATHVMITPTVGP